MNTEPNTEYSPRLCWKVAERAGAILESENFERQISDCKATAMPWSPMSCSRCSTSGLSTFFCRQNTQLEDIEQRSGERATAPPPSARQSQNLRAHVLHGDCEV
jgi:hypothetical protein